MHPNTKLTAYSRERMMTEARQIRPELEDRKVAGNRSILRSIDDGITPI